jgi:hypothetical protein
MIGMRMGFENPLQPCAQGLHALHEPPGSALVGTTGSRVVPENRVDNGALPAARIDQKMREGGGLVIEEGFDLHSRFGHR